MGSTYWFEIGAFRDGSCAGLGPMLKGGVPEGALTRLSFRRDDPITPRVGDLPRASYAIGAVAKDEQCAVLASGCVQVELGDDSEVLVPMSPVDPPTGACGTGASCQAARCVPANDNANPSVGAGCSLELLGAGPLANPVGGAGTLVSSPAISVTPHGFVIVYRELDPNASSTRVTVLPIDAAGGSLSPARPLLPGRCSSADESDGVGLIVDGDQGQIVLARPSCDGAAAGLELLSFTTRPDVAVDANVRVMSFSPSHVFRLSAAHVIAPLANGAAVAYTSNGASGISTVRAGIGVVDPAGSFGFQTGSTGAWVATSDRVIAVLSAGPALGGGGDPDAGEPDPFEDGPTLQLVIAPVATSLSAFNAQTQTPRAPLRFPGEWGAVAARGTRVITLSDGVGPGRSAMYRTWDLDKTDATDVGGFSLPDVGKITSGDVTIVGDRVYFAAAKAGSVSLHVYSNATTTLLPLREVVFGSVPRIPSVNTVRAARVAVAATDTRVAVTWTSDRELTANDATGGYAVFACTP